MNIKMMLSFLMMLVILTPIMITANETNECSKDDKFDQNGNSYSYGHDKVKSEGEKSIKECKDLVDPNDIPEAIATGFYWGD